MSSNPRITVFIPTFNRLEMLKQSVASVLCQGDFIRLHVLDNASSDGTAEWLRSIAQNDPRIQLTLRDQNLGSTVNYKDGFNSVQTTYFVPLADDDELAPGFLEAALRILESDSSLGAAIFTTQSRSEGQITGLSPRNAQQGRREPAAHLLEWAERGHYVSWSSILWRTECFRKLSIHSELDKFGLCSDVWIQFLFFADNPVFVDSRLGSLFNEHPSQASHKIGPHSIRDLGQMVEAMNWHLFSENRSTESPKKIFLRSICIFLNRVIRSRASKLHVEPAFSEVLSWMWFYMRYFYMYAGFKEFPLGSCILNSIVSQKNRRLIKSLCLFLAGLW